MPQNKISLIANGKVYSDIKEIKVVRDLDYLASSFNAVVANRFVDDSPLKIEQNIKVQIDNEVVLTGYIESLNFSMTTSDHSMSIVGNDITDDIGRCQIFNNAQYSFYGLEELCEKVLIDNGIDSIPVNDNTKTKGSDFADEEEPKQSGETGQSLFEFIDEYAEKSNKILTSDGKGNLVIFSNSGINKGITLNNTVKGNNQSIKSFNYRVDYSNRYKRVIVKSQGSDLSDGGDNIEGIAIDNQVKRNLTKIIISDTELNKETATKYAEWEVNKRRSDSITYNCEVPNFFSENGTLWQPNLLVSVIDDNAGINATMLLKRVEYNFSNSGGSSCTLAFVSEDTYTLKTEGSKLNKGLENE